MPAKISPDFTPRENLRLRIELLASKQKQYQISIIDEEYSKHNPIFDIDPFRGFFNAYDKNTNTYYYGVRNLEPEEFIKEGHIFVQMFNKIVKTETSNLVHGAVVGMDNQGILFCARGQRGKSTLAVLAMMKGFEYVSDDYLVLEKDEDKLYSHPIYSIITLSPRMYITSYIMNLKVQDLFLIMPEKINMLLTFQIIINSLKNIIRLIFVCSRKLQIILNQVLLAVQIRKKDVQ